MTNGTGFDIITLALSESAAKEKLENDTEKRRKNSQILRERRLDEAGEKGFGESGKEAELRIRIEHKSLILAQDERWRRA